MTSLQQPTEGASVGLSASVGFSLPIISKADAKAQGLSHYFTGKPCKYGHIAKRTVRTSTCCECAAIASKATYHKNQAKIAAGDMQPRIKTNQDRITARAATKRWYAENPSYRRLSTYNITDVQYNEMLSKQQHVCAICGNDVALVVDHCHTHGHVRGLLCNACNKGLGCFKDNTAALAKAIDYLINSTPNVYNLKRGDLGL